MLSEIDKIKLIVGALVIFIIVGGIRIKESAYEKKVFNDNEKRYEKLVNEEGKYKLTQKDLDEDHEIYVKDIKHVLRFHDILMVVFVALGILVMIMVFMQLTGLMGIFSEKNERIVTWLMIAGIGVVFAIGLLFNSTIRLKTLDIRFVPKYKYDYYELDVFSKNERIEITTSVDYDGDVDTEKTHHYYLSYNSNKQIAVSKQIYDRVKEYGVYYCGMTEKGDVFSIYPATEFELD